LRPLDASKCVCGQGSAPDPAGAAYSASRSSLAGFEEGNGDGKAISEKRMEGEWKGIIGGKGERRMEFRANWRGEWVGGIKKG